MSASGWQFWIDVGGTFTDCLAIAPDGSPRCCKVLSSGVVKGRCPTAGSGSTFSDPQRCGDPAGFWTGYECRLLDSSGAVIDALRVAAFDNSSGTLTLERTPQAWPAGGSYELWADQEAPVLAIRYLLGLPLSEGLPRASVRLGTTRGTNALLTRSGAATALVTSAGFADILHIGYQNRPQLFALNIVKPAPLPTAAIEIDERVAVDGTVLVPPQTDSIRRRLLALKRSGIESLAICLLNSYLHPHHELLVGRCGEELGFEEIRLSHQVAPFIKLVDRANTTVVDAYLNPVLRTYVERLRQHLGPGQLRLLTSAGGLVSADHFTGKDCILSGPAGGSVGFSKVAESAGYQRAIGFDMGGTSTDVSRWDGRFDMQYETEKAGARIVAPMIAIETVAAGGGSICSFDGVKLCVGPASAGADPGPACYGRGGPLTVTDVNFVLGKIPPGQFPFPLDYEAANRRLQQTADQIQQAGGPTYALAELAEGFVQVANANMIKAIRSISTARGYDPRDYVLVAFGGAAGQHACAIAAELGIDQILNHPHAGILSAYGIGMADVLRHQAVGIYQSLDEPLDAGLLECLDQLTAEARRLVREEGIAEQRIEVTESLDVRYEGQDASINILDPRQGNVTERFCQQHRRLYGYLHDDRGLEVVAARSEARGRSESNAGTTRSVAGRDRHPEDQRPVFFQGRERSAAVFDRRGLQPGDHLSGPAVVLESLATTVIDPGWEADVLSGGELLLARVGASPVPAAKTSSAAENHQPDPITLEIFNNHFASVAEQMGITLRNTASSVNVKERLDFSCAVFTSDGDLVVNAPHIPVHLGAMSETVKAVRADYPDLADGDVIVTNDPYRGGSHLPDITVVTPVFAGSGSRPVFFTASRAHHAEIGGIVPGSMPPFSKNLAEEGVLIRSFPLVRQGTVQRSQLRKLLAEATYPSRRIADNLADIDAQVAANRTGGDLLLEMVARYGLDTVTSYMNHIQSAAERKMRLALGNLADGVHRFEDHLDDGAKIQVAISVQGDQAVIDFAGSADVAAGNLNANRAIVHAAVIYCLRCLIDEPIPLNQGVLAPITVRVPSGLLNPPAADDPKRCAAVAGGNVETSQRVVDVLLGALQLAAASQGTMNNVLFGDNEFGYYETICGGAGATATADGADAVHTHMTNTRITDPEVMEQRFPVRVRQFAIRRGSGGAGRRRGGDGVIRQLEFLRPLQVSLLTQRRGPYPPYGLDGGQAGALGRNTLLRIDGTRVALDGITQLQVQPGDQLIMETPGGGGVGRE